MFIDQVGHLAHLHARDTSFALVSIAPLSRIEAYRKRMGWALPWVSSRASDFNRDFGLTTEGGESFGLSVFLRAGDEVYRTYFTTGRGVEALGSRVDISRPDAVRPARGVGSLSRRLAADQGVRMVAAPGRI
jgi:predicted dithiol-disulfide oxidoreductase (DUF899 family)